MRNTVNAFKHGLSKGQAQIGLWLGLADGYAAELLATTGFDWLLIDGEHAPNDLRSTLAQLQAVAPYGAHPIVRPVEGSPVLIKQLLDIGAQTLLVPMVESEAQASAVVAATRYPPRGIRGVGSALARSSRWNQVDGYLLHAEEELCLLLQIESVTAMQQLERISNVEGVDGVFFGPADLSASMGLIGEPGHPSVRDAIARGISIVRQAGRAAGVLTSDPSLARAYIELGANFVAVGVDTTLLVRAARDLCASFKNSEPAPVISGTY